MAHRTYPVGAQPLPCFTVRHRVCRTEFAEVTLGTQDVGGRQTRRVAGFAGRTKGAVRDVRLSGDGVICPVGAVVSLENGQVRERQD